MKKLGAALIVSGLLLTPLYPVYAQGTAFDRVRAQTPPITTQNVASGTPTLRVATGSAALKADERLAQVKARIASRSAQLRAKLNAFRDKRKAETVDRINSNLNLVNETRTGNMLTRLDIISSALTRLDTRVQESSISSKLTTSPQNSIDVAKLSITTAREAVQAQAKKDYIVSVSSESAVRTDVQTVRDQLHTDLSQTDTLVVNARKAVTDAIRAVVQSLGGNTNGQQ